MTLGASEAGEHGPDLELRSTVLECYQEALRKEALILPYYAQ